MNRSFLVRFARADARSLARAVILLFLLNGVFGAFHAGVMAGPASIGTILCTGDGVVLGGAGTPSVPAPGDHRLCCLLGCGTAQPGSVETADGQLWIEPDVKLDGRYIRASIAVGLRRPDNAGPRGPPVLT